MTSPTPDQAGLVAAPARRMAGKRTLPPRGGRVETRPYGRQMHGGCTGETACHVAGSFEGTGESADAMGRPELDTCPVAFL